MKKTLVLIVVLLLGGISFLHAQVEVKGTFGINAQRYSDDPDNFSQSARVGYALGGSLQFGKKFYVEPGIFWQKMGSEMVHKDQASLDVTTDINSVRIPLFVGYQILGGDEENIFGLRVFGGPTGSWITSVKNNDEKLEKEDFNSFLWGADLGAGIDLWLFFFDVGYEWGLNPVFKDDPNEAKTRMWWSNVGIRIRF